MRKIIRHRQFFMGLPILLVFSTTSCSIFDKPCTTSGLEVLSAQAVDQAESTYAAQSALEAMQRGDTEAATVILESQIRQGLIVLRSVRPQLVSGKALSVQEQENVDDAMKSAEKYAQDHKLTIPKP